jgi:chromosome partitioning protein
VIYQKQYNYKFININRIIIVDIPHFYSYGSGMNIVAIINQKGGVGKSTTAAAIGAALLLKGQRVLFIDLDAQGNLSDTIGAESGQSALELINKTVKAEDTIQRTKQGDIIASSPALAGADAIMTMVGKEYKLKEALDEVQYNYDFIIIDTPPALGILTVNALTACHSCIIPAQADTYSLQGIKQLYQTIEVVKRYCNPLLEVLGILLTRYNAKAVISREIAETIEEIAKELKTKLYKTKIRECIAIKEAQALKQNIFGYAPKSNAAIDYTALLSEILGD